MGPEFLKGQLFLGPRTPPPMPWPRKKRWPALGGVFCSNPRAGCFGASAAVRQVCHLTCVHSPLTYDMAMSYVRTRRCTRYNPPTILLLETVFLFWNALRLPYNLPECYLPTVDSVMVTLVSNWWF